MVVELKYVAKLGAYVNLHSVIFVPLEQEKLNANALRILRVQDLIHENYAKRCCLSWQLLPGKTRHLL